MNNLRHFSRLYFHGHTVGGTNPSLLEAMASSAHIAANDNEFNRGVLEEDAYYFSNAYEVKNIIEQRISEEERMRMIANNRAEIKNHYSWQKIIQSYEDLFLKLAQTKET